MFDKLEALVTRFEEIMNELGEGSAVQDPARFQKLMKEQSDLQPIVEAYKEYRRCRETVEDSLSMLEEEKDEEMRAMLKEELAWRSVQGQAATRRLCLRRIFTGCT